MADNCKLIIVLIVLSVWFCAATSIDASTSDSHNINQCDPTTVTLNLFQSNIFVPAELFDYVAKNVTYPETGSNTYKISCLKVIDVDTADNGGYPTVISGGVGWNFVEISLSSQWNQPLNFRIEIWTDE